MQEAWCFDSLKLNQHQCRRLLTSPELVINYSPALDLRITFVYAQGYEEVSLPKYRFAVDCLLRHAAAVLLIRSATYVSTSNRLQDSPRNFRVCNRV
jgi:hypothetical protein